MDSPTSTFWTGPVPIEAVSVYMEIPVLNASSVDPDQMLRSVASDLDLHCLSISLCGTLGINGLAP